MLLRSSWGLWSLGFLKIYAIFLGDLKIVWILCLFNILPIRCIILLIYGRMDRILSSGCVLEIVVILIVLIVLGLFCHIRFSVKLVLNSWVLSVDVLCQRWWKLNVQVSWLQTVFVLGSGTRHVSIYLCVCWFPVYLMS